MERVYEEGSPNYGAAKPWADIKQYQRDRCMTLARFALEAAAPHMLAEAWDEGYDHAESDHYGTGFWTKRLRANPHRRNTEAPTRPKPSGN